MTHLNRSLPKAPTGIQGLDEITGGAGCGKTLFAIEFLVRGATQYDEPGVLMAFEETARRVLVVEDESLVAMFIQDTLAEIGCEVTGMASKYTDAIEKAKSLSFDVAILDLNLNGQTSFAIADLLSERGVQFVFSTGYNAATLPSQFQAVPLVQKPFQKRHLESALQAALADPKRAKLPIRSPIEEPQCLAPNGTGVF